MAFQVHNGVCPIEFCDVNSSFLQKSRTPTNKSKVGLKRLKLQKRGKSELEPQISVNFFSVVKSILQ